MNENRLGPHAEQAGRCSCPFCDAPAEGPYPFCKNCGKVLNHCKVCGKPLPPHRTVCKDCEH